MGILVLQGHCTVPEITVHINASAQGHLRHYKKKTFLKVAYMHIIVEPFSDVVQPIMHIYLYMYSPYN